MSCLMICLYVSVCFFVCFTQTMASIVVRIWGFSE